MERNIFSVLNDYFNNFANHGTSDVSTMYLYEGLRLMSFHRVSVATSYIRLATAGFYATKNGDETRCFSCGATYRGWRTTDIPLLIHRQISPNCRHVVDRSAGSALDEPRFQQFASLEVSQLVLGNGYSRSGVEDQVRLAQAADYTPIGTSASSSTPQMSLTTEIDNNVSTVATLFQASIGGRSESTRARRFTSFHFEDAVYPHYSDLAARLKSFVTWPVVHCKKPENLANAGFFFAGYADCVRCFVCGVGLRTWEEEDDPWHEHVRWRSSCDFVKVVKGQDFVIQTLAAIGRQTQSAINSDILPSAASSTQTNAAADILDTVACRRAQEMGFDIQHVRQTAMVITSARGRQSLTLHVLIERLLLEDDTTASGTSSADTLSRQTGVTLDHHTNSGDDLASEDVSDDTRHHIQLSTSDTTGSVTDKQQQTARQPKSVESSGRTTGGVLHSGHNRLPAFGASAISGGRNREKPATTKNGSLPSYSQNTEEENRELKESSLCKVCLDDQANIVFLPCGHLVTCATCSPALDRCPVCRKHIRGTVRVYLANKASVQTND